MKIIPCIIILSSLFTLSFTDSIDYFPNNELRTSAETCLMKSSFDKKRTWEIDIPNDIEKEGGVLIYSIKVKEVMLAKDQGIETAWPKTYTRSSVVIYHYMANNSLYFKILEHDLIDSTAVKVSTYGITGMDCPNSDIFSCTYRCRNTKTNELFGFGSKLSDKELIFMINDVQNKMSIVFRAEIDDVVRNK